MKRLATSISGLALLAFAIESPAADPPAADPPTTTVKADPPAALVFTFKAEASKLLPGDSAEKARGWNCRGNLGDADQLGRVAVVSTHFQNGCYTNGKYNHRDYKVEKGVVVDATGKKRYEAYRVHGPAVKARRFLGSRHVLFYKVASKVDHIVYRFEGGGLAEVGTIAKALADPAAFVKLGVNVSELGVPTVFLVVPATERVSALASWGKGVEAGRLEKNAVGELFKLRYSVPGTPFDTATGFAHGPNTHANVYGDRRRFFTSPGPAGRIDLIWQDTATKAVQITAIAADRRSQVTQSIANPDKYLLAAAAGDGKGALFLLLIGDGDGARANQARGARLMSIDSAGKVTRRVELDTSKKGLDITMFAARNSASMVHHNGRLGVIVSRKMHRGGDGLNHQGAIALVFDATTLKQLRNWGQTSGHSFANVLTTSGTDFIGIDLGDNYPRGVHLHKFSDKRRKSRVVYTFKTRHGDRPISPSGRRYPAYPEISGGGKTFYKWSNDNRTYTELGGVVPGKDGIVVVFAGENSGTRAIDNARVGGYVNDSRNIGLVRVRSDFEKLGGRGNVVSDDLVLTSGAAETGGFYTFNGRWSEQRNKGVVWLTAYKDPRVANVSRLKAVGLANGSVVLLWETWTLSSYVSTHAARVDTSGKLLAGPITFKSAVRLNRRDAPWVDGNDVYLVSGDKAGQNLEVFQLRVK